MIRSLLAALVALVIAPALALAQAVEISSGAVLGPTPELGTFTALGGGITTSGTLAGNNAALYMRQGAGGNQAQTGISTNGLTLSSSKYVGWGSNTADSAIDTYIYRDAANTVAQRNGANAQTFKVYNSYTDLLNYERGYARWNGNVFQVGTENAGTGSLRVPRMVSGSSYIGFDATSPSDAVISNLATGRPINLQAPITVATGALAIGAAYGSTTTTLPAQAGDLILKKETDAGAAPGAGYCTIKVVAGTNAGSGKLIAYCGTSTTPVTIADNIGGGF